MSVASPPLPSTIQPPLSPLSDNGSTTMINNGVIPKPLGNNKIQNAPNTPVASATANSAANRNSASNKMEPSSNNAARNAVTPLPPTLQTPNASNNVAPASNAPLPATIAASGKPLNNVAPANNMAPASSARNEALSKPSNTKASNLKTNNNGKSSNAPLPPTINEKGALAAATEPKNAILDAINASLNEPVDEKKAQEESQHSFRFVSQSPFWMGAYEPNNNNNEEDGSPKAVYLSYDVFLGLTILGGFLALDHLYLRSPLTFLSKLLVNFFCFGIWWLYDAVQAVFHKEVVQVYGLGIPCLGPKGIAGGVFSKEKPDKKHMSFFIYAFVLIFLGVFGGDSFLMGDKNSGIIRALALFSVFLAPIAIGWWAYNVFRFFTNTQKVVQENGSFFGVPEVKPKSWIADKFPLLTAFLSPLEWIQNMLQTFLGPVIEPIAQVGQSAVATAQAGVDVLDGAVKVGQSAVNTAGKIANAVPAAMESVSKLSTISPGMSLMQTVTGPTTVEQTGGSQGLNVLPYTLLGTLTAVAAAGFGATYYRSKSKKNVREYDDVPPQPGVFRKSDR